MFAFSVDRRWLQLVQGLSGLLCASFNFLDATSTSAPQVAFQPTTAHGTARSGSLCAACPAASRSQHTTLLPGRHVRQGGVLRYGLLPRESVCTENLTPWFKLLPCHTAAGVATLFHNKRIYDSSYLKLGIHVTPAVRPDRPA